MAARQDETVPSVCEWSRRFRAARAYAGLSQVELSRRLQIGTTTIKRYEAAPQPPAPAKKRSLEERMSEVCDLPEGFFTDAAEPFAALDSDDIAVLRHLAGQLAEQLEELRPGSTRDLRRQLRAKPDA